jgi:hypothetical protein
VLGQAPQAKSPDRQLNMDPSVGNWVRNSSGALIWDQWDMDAPPDYDPGPRILDQLQRIRERMEADPDWKPPTPEQIEDGRRAFDEAIQLIRAVSRRSATSPRTSKPSWRRGSRWAR